MKEECAVYCFQLILRRDQQEVVDQTTGGGASPTPVAVVEVAETRMTRLK